MPQKQVAEDLDARAADIAAQQDLLQKMKDELDQKERGLHEQMIRFRNEVTNAQPGKAKPFDPVGDGGMVPVYYPTEEWDPLMERNKRVMKLDWVDAEHPLKEVKIAVDQYTIRSFTVPLQAGDKVEIGDKVMAAKAWPTKNIRINTDQTPQTPTVPKVKLNEFGMVVPA